MRTRSFSNLKQGSRSAESLQFKHANVTAGFSLPTNFAVTLTATLSSFCLTIVPSCYAATGKSASVRSSSATSIYAPTNTASSGSGAQATTSGSAATPAASVASPRAAVQPSVTTAKSAAFFTRAVQTYQRNDFKSAELFLRQAIAEAPSDPSSHYYLANTLVHLNRHDEAIDEFRRSYHLDPYGPTSGYCRKALKTYDGQSTKDDSAESIDATASMMRYAHKQPIAGDPQEKLVSLRLQAEREKVRHQQTADSYSRAINSTGEGEAQTIRQNARNDIEQIMHGTRNAGQPWLEQAATARAAEVQHNADEMEKIAHERASEKAAEYKALSKAKGKALDETVSNLERQLVTKTLPGTPTLRHDGTDLFVRHYAPSAVKSPYPEAHPAVARVNPVHVIPANDDDDSDATKAKSLPKHDVKGKVLN